MDTSNNYSKAIQEVARLLGWAPYSNCSAPSILHFPYLGLPDSFYGTILPFFILLYNNACMIVLCGQYFLPVLSSISDRLKAEVVRSTVMAAAASIPELAVSIIGTFFTEEDVGASAIVGSAVFNTLLIPALCALLTGVKEGSGVDVWALTRDSFMYGLSLLCLAIFFLGDVISWYEALTLLLLYLFYIGGMQIDKKLKRRSRSFYYKIKEEMFENSPIMRMGGERFYGGEPEIFSSCDEAIVETNQIYFTEFGNVLPWYKQIFYYIIWPINITMKYSIASNTLWMSLISCCIWIGVYTYISSWMISVISYKLRIPDSLMALTFLGIGVGIPELLISLNVAEKGKATLALCNALGSNIINTLLCLGLPWLAHMAINGTSRIFFNTDGLSYSCLLILFMVILLYLSLALNNFTLDAKIGWLLLTMYGTFLIGSILIELNVFFTANLPICNIKDYFND